MLRLAVPPRTTVRGGRRGVEALARELAERADGYREAVLAHLTLLLVEVARLAADVVGDLRVNREPLLADVFTVIERRYPENLSLRDVAREVNLFAGLTRSMRRRTARTLQEVARRTAGEVDGGAAAARRGRTCPSGRSAGGWASPIPGTSPGCSGRCRG